MLLTAAGLGTNAIIREAGVAKTAVRRWQERFMQEGVDGLHPKVSASLHRHPRFTSHFTPKSASWLKGSPVAA